MKHNLHRLCLLLALVLVLGSAAGAEAWIEPERECSLTVHYMLEGINVPGIPLRVYRFAGVDESVHFTPTDSYADLCPDINPQTAEDWAELSQTLKEYITANAIAPEYEGTTDSAGLCRFDGLQTGLYLVLGDSAFYDGYQYSMEPTIVMLPTNAEHVWVYDVTVIPKLSRLIPITSLRVIKEWNDRGSESKRPREITVQLFQDQTLYGTVELSQSNNWRHRWENLPERNRDGSVIEWTVSELAVANYKGKVRQSGTDFIITNTYNGPVPPSPPLPQTGQLWMPVYILSFLGLCCLAIGAMLSRRRDSE